MGEFYFEPGFGGVQWELLGGVVLVGRRWRTDEPDTTRDILLQCKSQNG